MLSAQGQDAMSGAVPADAREIAGEVALDHWLTWQIRHMAIDAAGVADLAAAYRRGEPFPERPLARDVDPGGHPEGRLDRAEPSAEHALPGAGPVPGTAALTETSRSASPTASSSPQGASEAVQAYRGQIAGSADRQPDAWIGLALALRRLPGSPSRAAFATRLPLLFDVHACLGGRADPLDLAGWFG